MTRRFMLIFCSLFFQICFFSSGSALAADIFSNNPAEVQKAIKQGVDVNAVDQAGQTPLLVALSPDEGPINFKLVTLLLKAGANPNVESKYGMIPLLSAVTAEDMRVLEALLKAGADVNMANQIGATALHGAATAKNTRIVELLLKAGAKVNVSTQQGMTPLINAAGFALTPPETVARLIASGADVNAQATFNGQTPLLAAAELPTNKPDIILLLLKAGADPGIKNNKGETALDVAKRKKKPESILRLIREGVK